MNITVVNIRDLPEGWQQDERYIYVGRANPRKKLKGHPLANPYKIGVDGNRSGVVEKYRDWLAKQPMGATVALFDQCLALTKQGKEIFLVCWCSPDSCHGHWLLYILKKMWAGYSYGYEEFGAALRYVHNDETA